MSINHECKHEREFIEIREAQHSIRAKIEKMSDRITANLTKAQENDKKQITWAVFWSIVLLLVALGGGALSAQYSKLEKLDERVNENRLSSATIQTQLAQIQKDLLEIKVSLKEHSTGK